jgi:hypothetical protein
MKDLSIEELGLMMAGERRDETIEQIEQGAL